MTDTGNELSEILSDTPAPAAVTGADTAAAPADTGQGRDEHGRFAPKAGDTAQPAATEQPAPGATTEEQSGTTVPLAALHAERQKNADLGRQIAELTAKFDGFSRAQPRPIPAQQPEQPKPKDLWEDPEGFVKQALAPLQNEGQRQFERTSRMMAVFAHGEEKVSAAYGAIKSALETNPQSAVFEYQKIMASEHPYDELVKWHQRSAALSRVGNDPDAFVKSELDKLLADPAKAAEILQRIQAGVTAQPANRSAPAIALPPSLHNLPGGTNTASAGLGTDEERFKAALAR